MVNPSILNTAKRYVSSIPPDMGVKRAYLFGSYAKGTNREGSDIDIALVFDYLPDFYAVQLFLMKLRRNLDLRIEPHPMEDQDFNGEISPLAREVAKTGVQINLAE